MEITSRVYHWHSQFNVYVLKNKDVLLLSPGQQLLLPQQQFPFLDEINGERSVDDILHSKNQLDERSSLFLFQINKLIEMQLISEESRLGDYVKPSFDTDVQQTHVELDGLKQNMFVLSICATKLVSELVQLLSETDDVIQAIKEQVSFNILLVDDFLDPRITTYLSQHNLMLVKLTGDAISVSPIFHKHEVNLLKGLQWQLGENQPVRKMLLSSYPDGLHTYPFKLNTSFTSTKAKALKTLLLAQLNQNNKHRSIALYREVNNDFEYHAINEALDNDVNFARQINSPISLNPCVSHFNIDGGSRNVTATTTVERLMPLVSPITGIINHLEVIGEREESPIKIYRTGFFKHHNKPDVEVFDRNSFVQICLGKGVSHDQSKASALSEAIERYAALYQGDVDLNLQSQSELIAKGLRSYNFQSLVPYSQAQYRKFNTPSHPDSALKQAATPYEDQAIHWLPVWSLTASEQVYVPLSQCFSNIPFDDDKFGRWHSNGCAAGNTLEEATLQALFELIERDATAIWWYNKLNCPVFDLSRLNQENLVKLDACLSSGQHGGHDYWVLDITSDLGIPVMGAIGQDKHTGGLVMGFGCHLVPEMAAQRALTELCQLIPIRDQNAAPFDFDAIEKSDYIFGDKTSTTPNYAIEASLDIKDDIIAITECLKVKGMEVLVMNYSRAHIPLNTAKVFVPGLCHIWPQFANDRLYQAPLRMGHLDIAYDEGSINQQALYI